MNFGSSRLQNTLKDVKRICTRRGRTISSWGRIFCAKFWTRRRHWKACQKVWRGKCYRVEKEDKYPIERPQEEDGFDLTVKEDKERYLTTIDGDI